ncbi:MAG: IPT/TIG domain-containing protein [Candidatus Methylomirabilales bacterium]
MRIAKPLFVLGACLFLLLAGPSVQAQEIRYFYDDLGRLSGVVDQQGNAARYVYDAVGNILEIRRTNVADFPGNVAITFFDPDQGQVGTMVTIVGAGFSPVPSDNQVTFNGTPAAVTASTSQTITTAVPAGATTGPIAVTTPLGSATSRENFTVLKAFAVIPEEADVVLDGSVGFQAILDGTPTSAVTWRVNGTVGGSPEQGTITPDGIYTAPTALPSIQPVRVEAVLNANPAQVARATVRVVGQAAGLIAAPAVTVGVIQATAAQAASGPVTVKVIQPTEAQAAAGPVTVGVVQSSAAQASAGPVTVGVIQSTAAQATSGPVTVALTSEEGAQALSGPLSVTGGPVVTAVAPASGAAGSIDLPVTITGVNLQGATGIQWVREGRADSTLTATAITPAPDGTTATFTVTISATAPLGPRVLRMVTPQGTSTVFDIGTNIFTVTSP